jgi:hypothetical protein
MEKGLAVIDDNTMMISRAENLQPELLTGTTTTNNNNTERSKASRPNRSFDDDADGDEANMLMMMQKVPDADNWNEYEEEDNDDEEYNNNNNNKHNNNNAQCHDDDDNDDNEAEEEDSYFNHRRNKKHVLYHREPIEKVPREVVVSSIYLGGVGVFLAIAPLCMWDTSCTAAFCFGLLIIASLTESDITLWLLVSSCITLTSIVWIDKVMNDDPWLGMGDANTTTTTTMARLIPSAAGAPWPHIMVAAASPFLLRAAGGTNSILYHRLSPSQTLETSLPVSVVLAILVLCWFVFFAFALLLLFLK